MRTQYWQGAAVLAADGNEPQGDDSVTDEATRPVRLLKVLGLTDDWIFVEEAQNCPPGNAGVNLRSVHVNMYGCC